MSCPEALFYTKTHLKPITGDIMWPAYLCISKFNHTYFIHDFFRKNINWNQSNIPQIFGILGLTFFIQPCISFKILVCRLNRYYTISTPNRRYHRTHRDTSSSPKGLYSLSRRMSYRKISQSFQSLWNLTGTSLAVLPEMVVKFQSGMYEHYNIQSRGFKASQGLAVRRIEA